MSNMMLTEAQSESGQAFLETLIVLPLLLLLLAAVIGFGRIMYVGLVVVQAAFTGGRFAAESLSVQQAATQAYQASAYSLANAGLDPGLMTWRMTATNWGRGIEVSNYVATGVGLSDIPLGPQIFGAQFTLRQRATFRVQRWKSRWE